LITHCLVGVAAGMAVSKERMSARFWALSVLCSVIPDADVIGFAFKIPYSNAFGHRGFFHSIVFGLLLGFFVVFVFFRKEEFFSRGWWVLAGYFSLLSASHGLLDALTDGGLGVALLAPFDNTRYFFPLTPIEVSPITLKDFFSEWGFGVLMSEFWWVWVPTTVSASYVRWKMKPAFFPRV
jgi:inner membrane protein